MALIINVLKNSKGAEIDLELLEKKELAQLLCMKQRITPDTLTNKAK